MYFERIHTPRFVDCIIASVDSICIALGYILIFLIKFKGNIPQRNVESFIKTIPYICIVAVLLFSIYGMYSFIQKNIGEIIFSIALISILLMIISTSIAFFVRGFAFPRSIILMGMISHFFVLSIWRIVLWFFLLKIQEKKKLMVIGNDSELDTITHKILSHNKCIEIKYLVNLDCKLNDIFILLNDVDNVIISSEISEKKKNSIISACISSNKDAFIIPDFFSISIKNAKLYQFDDVLTFKINGFNLSAEQKMIKRLFDIIFSLTCIILTLPLMIIIGLCIKLDSTGPILFKQSRVTEDNKIFKIYKFRTMIQDAENETGPMLALQEDPRITKLGKLLRTSHLDELPQFFNILFGHMSVVGPRPERPFFVEQFKNMMPEYEYRTIVKAGMTGLAQVLGKYSTSPRDKLNYDLMYIRNYSVFLDFKLVLQTIKIMFVKESSEGIENENSTNKMAGTVNSADIDTHWNNNESQNNAF